MTRHSLATALLAVALPVVATGADWPQFRGPDGQGHSTSTGVPITWSETENIAWKTAIEGLGWSSPAIQGEQIWITSAVDTDRTLRAVCVHRTNGKILHDVEVFKHDELGSIHANNSHASPTPVIDGDRVYVNFGAHGTACLTTGGEIVWKTQELKYAHGHGPAGSPVVWQDLVFINCDGTDVQYVAALDKTTGSIRWKKDRAHISEERKSGKLQVPMAYCTPLLLEFDGRMQLVSLGSDAVVAHEPATGEEIWWIGFSGYSNVARPVYGHGMLYFSIGFGEPKFLAVKVPGQGDLTGNQVWLTTKGALVPLDVSPLLAGNELYTISDAGIGVCYDALSGKQHWTKRLGAQFWASPVYAEGRIYCLDAEGTTTVLTAGTAFEELAKNKLDGAAQASPAIVDGAIFLRTDKFLYRIENAKLAATD